MDELYLRMFASCKNVWQCLYIVVCVGIVPRLAIQVEIYWKEKNDENDWVTQKRPHSFTFLKLNYMPGKYNIIHLIVNVEFIAYTCSFTISALILIHGIKYIAF